jgi:hypothetical protein
MFRNVGRREDLPLATKPAFFIIAHSATVEKIKGSSRELFQEKANINQGDIECGSYSRFQSSTIKTRAVFT